MRRFVVLFVLLAFVGCSSEEGGSSVSSGSSGSTGDSAETDGAAEGTGLEAGEPCTSPDECGPGLICHFGSGGSGACRPEGLEECDDRSGCSLGHLCRDGLCYSGCTEGEEDGCCLVSVPAEEGAADAGHSDAASDAGAEDAVGEARQAALCRSFDFQCLEGQRCVVLDNCQSGEDCPLDYRCVREQCQLAVESDPDSEPDAGTEVVDERCFCGTTDCPDDDCRACARHMDCGSPSQWRCSGGRCGRR